MTKTSDLHTQGRRGIAVSDNIFEMLFLMCLFDTSLRCVSSMCLWNLCLWFLDASLCLSLIRLFDFSLEFLPRNVWSEMSSLMRLSDASLWCVSMMRLSDASFWWNISVNISSPQNQDNHTQNEFYDDQIFLQDWSDGPARKHDKVQCKLKTHCRANFATSSLPVVWFVAHSALQCSLKPACNKSTIRLLFCTPMSAYSENYRILKTQTRRNLLTNSSPARLFRYTCRSAVRSSHPLQDILPTDCYPIALFHQNSNISAILRPISKHDFGPTVVLHVFLGKCAELLCIFRSKNQVAEY